MIPLTLHVGTPKTATTSIQESLWLNHRALADSGLYYCSNLGQTNNIDLFLACLHHNEAGFGILENRGIIGEARRNEFRDTVSSRLKSNALHVSETPGMHRLIASSEHFWFLWSDVHFQNLRTILNQSGVYIDRVIVYFRSQSDLLYSALSTMVRDGFCLCDVDASSLGSHELEYLNYNNRLNLWKSHFPEAGLQPYLFNDHKQSILAHFYAACSCRTNSLVRSPVMNESLSDTGIALISELNRRFLDGMTRSEVVQFLERENPRTVLGRLIEKHFPGKPEPKPTTVDAINSFYRSSNHELLAQFFPGRQLEDLCPDSASWRPADTSNFPASSIPRVVDILLDALSLSDTRGVKHGD